MIEVSGGMRLNVPRPLIRNFYCLAVDSQSDIVGKPGGYLRIKSHIMADMGKIGYSRSD